MRRRMWSWLRVVVAVVTSLGWLAVASPAEAANTESAQIGMPFGGQWAYNAHVNPPYTDGNSSHPSVHDAPGGGDWAIDLYAPADGTPVVLRIGTASGAVSFVPRSSSTGCGQSVRFDVVVDGVTVGWVYVAHLATVSGVIANGQPLGTVANQPSGCNPGRHVHVEVRKLHSDHACWYDRGNPGAQLGDGTPIGLLGADNNGPQQACSGPQPGVGATGPAAQPAVVQRSSGETDVAAVGPDNRLTFYFNAAGSPSWGQITVAGPGSAFSAPAMVQRSSGETDVVVAAPANHLDFYFNEAGNPTWSRLTIA